jgi:hypothetical protein
MRFANGAPKMVVSLDMEHTAVLPLIPFDYPRSRTKSFTIRYLRCFAQVIPYLGYLC